ncbi:hypothetical protein [Bacillus badius]|uniref:Uncharacterized protein n=1 Tax=Bacillus badius TaxID=1455 RepID=A0ABR5ATJ2_BACBA|nr:hypothetical protein [Bacillus badius]KIL72911.1 hypothetical protein SD78_4082 [Bacillus badius]KIL78073.1 hypothetical protein SD77_0674 [Bacillus badius]MED4717119.1 hypothetical protein [Bacillus badius]
MTKSPEYMRIQDFSLPAKENQDNLIPNPAPLIRPFMTAPVSTLGVNWILKEG